VSKTELILLVMSSLTFTAAHFFF
ncbi:uncharacterized protein METZ01_LOCUS174327, partial [marine metagenome]